MSTQPQLKTIFGSTLSWPKFVAVNDTLRGGSSTSTFKVIENNNSAIFSGHLDIKTLGGAGFASQCHTFPTPLSLSNKLYSGLTLLIPLPSISSTSNEPTSFVLTLKNVIPAERNYGGGEGEKNRRESVINYEFSFDLKDLMMKNSNSNSIEKGDEEKGEIELVQVEMRWNEFKAVFRGREQKDAKPLDSEKLTESGFGKQEGDFKLNIHSLSANLIQQTSTNESNKNFLFLNKILEWFIRIKFWFNNKFRNDGRIKL